MTLAASLLLLPLLAARVGGDDELQVNLVAWDCSGLIGTSSSWRGATVVVHGDVVQVLEVTLQFERLPLEGEDARWFKAPRSAAVASFRAWEQLCRGSCRDDALKTLLAEPADVLVKRSTGVRNCRETQDPGSENTGKRLIVGTQPVQFFTSGDSGVMVSPREGTKGMRCVGGTFDGTPLKEAQLLREQFDLTTGATRFDGRQEPPEGIRLAVTGAGKVLLKRFQEFLASRRPDPSAPASGGDALIFANSALFLAAETCSLNHEGEISLTAPPYPGEFTLFASTASPASAAATAAFIARLSDDRWDREVALRLLGDRPYPEHADALVVAAEGSIADHNPLWTSLALRALAKARPEEARRLAAPLLDDDDLWQAAAGVFVLSDPALARRLADLDAGSVAVREEVRRYVLEQREAMPSPDRPRD